MRKLSLVALLTAFTILGAHAQKTFSEVDSKTFEKKGNFNVNKSRDKQGLGYSNLSGHKISKVALVSFSNFMPPDQDKYGSYSVTTGASGEMIKLYANEMHDQSIGKLKEVFQEHGVELLAKDDFTSEQQELIKNVHTDEWIVGQLDEERTKKISAGYASWYETSTWSVGRPAYDYPHFKSVILTQANSSTFGILAKALGVDAVVLINHKFSLDKGAGYGRFEMTMIGPNPIPIETVRAGAKSKMHLKIINNTYFDGVLFVSSNFEFSKPMQVAELKKRQFGEADWSGFGDFMKIAFDVSLTKFEAACAK